MHELDVTADKRRLTLKQTVCLLPPVCFWVLWLIGQIVRDRTWLTGLLFYIPSPVVLCVLFVYALYYWCKKRWTTAVFCLLLALAPGTFVCCVENHLDNRGLPIRKNDGAIRLVHWNVLCGNFGWDGVAADLRASNAQLYCLSESPCPARLNAFIKSLGDGYQKVCRHDMTVIGKGPFRDVQWLVNDSKFKVWSLVWQREPMPLKIFFVDLASNPILPRGPRLHKLAELLVEHQPDLVVGDFNAPRLSRFLCPLPSGFVHAYEAVGNGWSYSWPMPCPVYAIDQCIAGKRIEPLRYSLKANLHSDHRKQIFDFTTK